MPQPINILIVDDEPKNLTVLETILIDPSYRLVRAESADEALLALIKEEFALLILDIYMPGMTGFELAQLIKDRKKTACVPIIFLTAYYNEDQHMLEGYSTGAVDYLHKPVIPAVLRSKVAVFAELHRVQREARLANVSLHAEVAERRRGEEKLRELNDTLEQRVTHRTEALREADRRKDEFLATLAHELRNPLAPIRNALEILRLNGPMPPVLKSTSEIIDRQLQQMTRLIDDLMDVSRINQGKIQLKREDVELATVLQAAVESSRPLIERSGHELTVVIPGNSVVIDADLTRLSQVFLNLLNNSAKYMDPGGRIEIRAEQQGSDVEVTVKDSGIGIPADKLPTIFEIFSQVESALSRSQGGLGIGLCLVKRLVEMHGGRIEARSDGIGKGAEFIVRLPVVVKRSMRRSSVNPEVAICKSSLRILVVDDNRDNADTLAMMLKEMGNDTCTVYDGEQALAAQQAYLADVILLDIGLPKMNGYEVCRQIRQQNEFKNLVIIAQTGWGQEQDRQLTHEAGFDYHMVKPVDPTALIKLLAGLSEVAEKNTRRQEGILLEIAELPNSTS